MASRHKNADTKVSAHNAFLDQVQVHSKSKGSKGKLWFFFFTQIICIALNVAVNNSLGIQLVPSIPSC
jgi:hypothetical protein